MSKHSRLVLRFVAFACIIALVWGLRIDVRACGFVEQFASTPTISRDARTSNTILYGYVENPRKEPDAAEPLAGTTEYVITRALKRPDALAGVTRITLPRYVPVPDGEKPPRYIIFGDMKKDQFEPMLGLVASEAFVEFVKGLIAIDADNRVAVMQYCFRFLEHADENISQKAFLEFVTSPDDAIGKAARTFAPDRLRRMIAADKTPSHRLRLYGFLLGNCGSASDARLLRRVLDEHTTEAGIVRGFDLDGVISGYVLLAPDEGWRFVTRIIENSDSPFVMRFAARRAVRFFAISRPDVITLEKRLAVMRRFLTQRDFDDFAVEDLRSRREWQLTADVLALWQTPKVTPITKRVVLRYAIECPDPAAQRFIADRRRSDADAVREVEELLELERKAAQPNPR